MTTNSLLNATIEAQSDDQFTYFDLGISFFNRFMAVSICPADFPWKEKPWVAWVKGKNKEFRKEIVFVNCEPKKLEGPNGDELLFFCFMLEEGKIYEFRNFYVEYDWDQKQGGFIGLNKYGLRSFTKDEINKILFGGAKKRKKI